MDAKFKELIAVGASVTANCLPCLEVHVKAALEAGATEKEIAIAAGVGKQVRKGAQGKMDALIASLANPGKSEGEEEVCGCA